jgi:hypothetical protein
MALGIWTIHSKMEIPDTSALPSVWMTALVLFYGVVSARTERVVEFFLEREATEAMIGGVGRISPCWGRISPCWRRICVLRWSSSRSARRDFESSSFRVGVSV